MKAWNDTIQQLATQPKSWDAKMAYVLSVASTWCYSNTSTLKNTLSRIGMPDYYDVKEFSVRNPGLLVDVKGFYVTPKDARGGNDLHILCFRGTEPTNPVDILTDALVEAQPWNDTIGESWELHCCEWVHRGFYISLDVIWHDLKYALENSTGRLAITGHSLGGAIAVLAGRRFNDEINSGLTLAGVYTFGQPMVGNWGDENRSIEAAEVGARSVSTMVSILTLPRTSSNERFGPMSSLSIC